jgi:YD repeat-containing protein
MKNYSIILIVSVLLLLSLVQLASATSYEYDTLNRLTRATYDSGFQILYSYDEVGNRTQRIATNVADIIVDGSVNFKDFVLVGAYWMQTDCNQPDWCEGTDFDHSGSVDMLDLATFARYWLEGL